MGTTKEDGHGGGSGNVLWSSQIKIGPVPAILSVSGDVCEARVCNVDTV